MTQPQGTRLAYSPQEAAALLGVSAKTIYREIQAGNLVARKIGGGRAIRISAESLNAYVEGGTDQP